MTKKQIEEIIWEVDEDLDKCLNWDEFRLMYERNITDKTGLEPSRMVSNTICKDTQNIFKLRYRFYNLIHQPYMMNVFIVNSLTWHNF